MPDSDDYLTPREAAERYKVSTRTILRRIHDGTLPAVRVGPKLFRIAKADLDKAFTSTRARPRAGRR